jgi:hypothetical protein
MTAFLCISVVLFGQLRDPVLSFRVNGDKEREVVAKLPGDLAATLPKGRLTPEQGQKVLTLGLIDDDTKKAGPAMLGKYERTDNELVFTPRFPFGAGQTYRADLHLPAQVITLEYKIPAAAAKAPPKVVKIYPSADVLPANHLRFYIFFDRPMRGGKDLFKNLVLIDDKGKEVEDPWLIDEIWDEENNCLILFIHPGRIKWGVELRELMGPVLYEKRQYSLIVRGELTDIDGNKIGKDFVKKFRTTPEDRVRIDLSKWDLLPARAGSGERLILTLPKSVDYRSLQRFLTVTDTKGKRMEGTIEIGKDEKEWAFLPKNSSWPVGTYHLEVSGELEDVCGNTPLRPFDLDLKAKQPPPQKLRIPFKCVGDR